MLDWTCGSLCSIDVRDDATDLKIGRIRGVVHVVVMCRVCDSEGYDCSESCLV